MLRESFYFYGDSTRVLSWCIRDHYVIKSLWPWVEAATIIRVASKRATENATPCRVWIQYHVRHFFYLIRLGGQFAHLPVAVPLGNCDCRVPLNSLPAKKEVRLERVWRPSLRPNSTGNGDGIWGELEDRRAAVSTTFTGPRIFDFPSVKWAARDRVSRGGGTKKMVEEILVSIETKRLRECFDTCFALEMHQFSGSCNEKPWISEWSEAECILPHHYFIASNSDTFKETLVHGKVKKNLASSRGKVKKNFR